MNGQVWIRPVEGSGEWVPLNGVVADGFEFVLDTEDVPVKVPVKTSFTTSWTIPAPQTRREKRNARAFDRLMWGWHRPDPGRQLIHNGRKP